MLICFVGASGVGKSTILNTVLGQNSAATSSWVPGGGRVTIHPRGYIVNTRGPLYGHNVVDYPGIEDNDTESIVVRAIKRALRSGQPIKIVFVINNQGRINDDLFRLPFNILTQLPHGLCFSVILNKLPPGVMAQGDDFLTSARRVLGATSVHLIGHSAEAYADASDGQLPEYCQGVLMDFLAGAPEARIEPAEMTKMKKIRDMTEGERNT